MRRQRRLEAEPAEDEGRKFWRLGGWGASGGGGGRRRCARAAVEAEARVSEGLPPPRPRDGQAPVLPEEAFRRHPGPGAPADAIGGAESGEASSARDMVGAKSKGGGCTSSGPPARSWASRWPPWSRSRGRRWTLEVDRLDGPSPVSVESAIRDRAEFARSPPARPGGAPDPRGLSAGTHRRRVAGLLAAGRWRRTVFRRSTTTRTAWWHGHTTRRGATTTFGPCSSRFVLTALESSRRSARWGPCRARGRWSERGSPARHRPTRPTYQAATQPAPQPTERARPPTPPPRPGRCVR